MKKLIVLILTAILLTTLTACDNSIQNNNSTTPTFEVGKTVPGTLGDSFEIFKIVVNYEPINEKASITVKVTMEKENSIEDINSYSGYGYYHRYSYKVEISGKVNSSHQGSRAGVVVAFSPNEYLYDSKGEYSSLISPNGEFSYSYYYLSNQVLTEWTPRSMSINN